MTRYAPAPEVAETAAELINEHHSVLSVAPILYVFRAPALRTRGRVVLGTARKITGLAAFLADLAAGEVEDDIDLDDADVEPEDRSFFVMEVAFDEWARATAEHRRALVDHELCHFAIDDEGQLAIRGHDLEEFTAVVERHGLWRDDVRRFAGACSASVANCVSV